jgi:hypothetical protein
MIANKVRTAADAANRESIELETTFAKKYLDQDLYPLIWKAAEEGRYFIDHEVRDTPTKSILSTVVQILRNEGFNANWKAVRGGTYVTLTVSWSAA